MSMPRALLPIAGVALLFSACASAPPSEGAASTSPAPVPVAAPAVPAPAPVAAPAASPPPAPFPEAIARAGERLLQDAVAVVGPGPRDFVIDPLVDANTGAQTAGTVAMGQQIAALVKTKAPTWNVRPLSRASLAGSPLVFIGTLTPINTKNDAAATADAFRACMALIDLRTGKLVAKRADRATLDSVNAEPTAFYRDSPTWARDRTTNAYVKSCQGSTAGDIADPAYLIRLPAAALLNEAVNAYGAGRLADAYRLYRDASLISDPADLRVLNGVYLTSWRTGKKKEAADAFGRIVEVGLESKRLPIKLFFNPGTTALLSNADLRAQYALWLREVAARADASDNCLKITGHTSRTGSADANDALSRRRAVAVQEALERQNKKLVPRLSVEGMGSREVLVGLGTDDLRDALDRRVEFRTVDCS
jgi:outer membrane protein OmpA-like peptidoglycan-associated protein